MGDLPQMYATAADLLAARDFTGFRWLQQVMADVMDDAGSPNAWVLRLDWRTKSAGPYPIFSVEVPKEAEGWLDPGRQMGPADTEYTAQLRPAARRLLGRGSMLGARPFAGFPAFGLRFLGRSGGWRHFWRFSYGARRSDGMGKGWDAGVEWVRKKKWAEDIYPGGYLNLFYPPGTRFGWRSGEWWPSGDRPTMADLFAAAEG